MLIDFHAHCFPDAIAPRAMEKLAFAAGGLSPIADGTRQGLLDSMDREGVDLCAVLNIATGARQMRSVNDFAASLNGDRLAAFGSVHPLAENALAEIDRIADMGLCGIKFHPEYQDFFVDDPMMKPIYQRISRRGLIVSFHAGKDYGYPAPWRCTPRRLLRALAWLDTDVIAAHWGGLGMEEEVLAHLAGREVYFDTAFAAGTSVRPMLMKILEQHGANRVLFGTDAPWHSAGDELRALDTLGLTHAEREDVTWKNGAALLAAHGCSAAALNGRR